jgi:mxaL protein
LIAGQAVWALRHRVGAERARLALAAALLAATFLNPGWVLPRQRFEHIVVLDVTQSMNVPDAQWAGQPISRLAYARHALHEALPVLPCGSRVGWALFTEYRSYLLFTPVEVCAHRAELRRSLAAIDGRMAWSGNSEIAKGLHSAVKLVKELPGTPSLVFITDGHESPPLSPRHRPPVDDKAGEVAGLIVGVGQAQPSPIPKTDPQGRPLGYWRADEVLQTDPRSLGRGGSVGGERMVDEPGTPAAAGLGATPGSEHLSGLRDSYLRLLASEHGWAYLPLQGRQGPQQLATALRSPSLARPVPMHTDGRVGLAALAFALLLTPYAAALWRRAWAGRSVTRPIA